MAITTIPKNATRKIAELAQRLTACKVYTLDNGFIGEVCDPAWAWKALESRGAKLYDSGDGTYTVQVHSNCWYELSAPAAPAKSEAPAATAAETRDETRDEKQAKLRAAIDGQPVLMLAEALLELGKKPNLEEHERLVRALMIDSLCDRSPEAQAAFDTWAESDDAADEIAMIVEAVVAAEEKKLEAQQ